jgi:hypothetical protein
MYIFGTAILIGVPKRRPAPAGRLPDAVPWAVLAYAGGIWCILFVLRGCILI